MKLAPFVDTDLGVLALLLVLGPALGDVVHHDVRIVPGPALADVLRLADLRSGQVTVLGRLLDQGDWEWWPRALERPKPGTDLD